MAAKFLHNMTQRPSLKRFMWVTMLTVWVWNNTYYV